MRIERITLLRLRIPFSTGFAHAVARRTCSDTLLVVLRTAAGAQGFGEILARDYVTGESNDRIFADSGPALGAELLGRRFDDQAALAAFIEGCLREGRWQPALFGGFELALWHAFALSADLDLAALLGPQRRDAAGKCATIGLDCPAGQLRHRARLAKLGGATAIKLKVGGDCDLERLQALNEALQGNMPIRLDANGSLQLQACIDLLKDCAQLPIASIEQPFAKGDADLAAKLKHLYAQTAVPIVADESLCSIADAEQLLGSGVYQAFNLRIGKHGGLLATAKIRDMARAAGIGLVAGTLVGESGVLNQAAQLLLRHSPALPYVEGLGQNRTLLQMDPVKVETHSTASMPPITLRQRALMDYVSARKELR